MQPGHDTAAGARTGADERPPELYPFGSERPRRKRRTSAMPIAFGVCLLAVAAGAAWVTMGPRTAIIDAMNGATPDLSEAKDCLRRGQVTCAEGDFRAYLKKYPDDAHANAILAITLTRDGKHDEALPFYKHAADLGVSTYDLHAGYAISLNNTGQTDAAIRENYAALKLVPSLVDVRGALADQLVKKGRGPEALKLLSSFDHDLEDRGIAPYFPTKIDDIRVKLGMAPLAEPVGFDGSPIAAPGASSDVHLQSSHGALYAQGVVDGSLTLDFVVDSGASFVCITSDVAQTLMRTGKLTRADFRGYGVAELADGSRVMSQMVMLHSLSVGGHEVRNVRACVTGGRGSLLLGQSYLRRFKSWSVDNDRRVLVLKD